MDFGGDSEVPVEVLDDMVDCPVCGQRFPASAIEAHVNTCLGGMPPQAEMCVPCDSGLNASNLPQWVEFQMHDLSQLLQDIGSLKQADLEQLEGALAGQLAQLREAREKSTA